MWVLALLGCNRCEEVCTAWLLNESGETSPRLSHLVDVTAVTEVEVEGVSYVLITTESIPSYETELTQDQVDTLDARPLADDDFKNGSTAAVAGQEVLFGDDIGYDSTSDSECAAGAGYGFWPPGQPCPEAQALSWYVPRIPIPAADEVCTTAEGPVGLWLNGLPVHGWSDGTSLDDQDVWHPIAPTLEAWDTDVCSGQVDDGQYHHHIDPTCLGEQLGDVGDGHSPIYGFAADGHAIHGPWTDAGERAKSCWIARDYDDPDDPLGCGGVGERRCLPVDPKDPDAGTEATAFPGPTTSDTVTSASGNPISAALPLFVEDHVFDDDCDGLDAHNGHEHGGHGYHYHVTDDFPFTVGPTLWGRVRPATEAGCGD
ncbi:MAG: YHYH protein [Proteobacteria bacterium]|nr:YHYH protein [Pseudomonadota bacterium]MCP4916027.1 YHYH protein [Pseudomonadota bacterium]